MGRHWGFCKPMLYLAKVVKKVILEYKIMLSYYKSNKKPYLPFTLVYSAAKPVTSSTIIGLVTFLIKNNHTSIGKYKRLKAR